MRRAVWYSNFGEQAVGKLDQKTGKVTEYSIPEQKHRVGPPENWVFKTVPMALFGSA